MTSPVRVEGKVWTDRRFKRAAQLADRSKRDILGGMVELWAIATDSDCHCVDLWTVADVFESDDAVNWLRKSELASSCSSHPARLLLTGGDRLDWLKRKRKVARTNGAKGGRPAKNQPDNQVGFQRKPSRNLRPEKEQENEIELEKEIEPEKEKEKRASVREITARVVDAFNRAFRNPDTGRPRGLGSKGFEDQVKRLLAKRHTEGEMMGVVWWAARNWAEEPDWRMRIDPSTLLKLQSSQGAKTFPQYLALAGERWREEHAGETPSWELK